MFGTSLHADQYYCDEGLPPLSGVRIVEHHPSSGDDSRWDNYVALSAFGSLYHSSIWRDVIESAFGKQAIWYRAETTEGSIVGVLPLVRIKTRLLGDRLVSMPYANYGGVLADTESIEASLEQTAVNTGRRL